jgi:hypothetical protein
MSVDEIDKKGNIDDISSRNNVHDGIILKMYILIQEDSRTFDKATETFFEKYHFCTQD